MKELKRVTAFCYLFEFFHLLSMHFVTHLSYFTFYQCILLLFWVISPFILYLLRFLTNILATVATFMVLLRIPFYPTLLNLFLRAIYYASLPLFYLIFFPCHLMHSFIACHSVTIPTLNLSCLVGIQGDNYSSVSVYRSDYNLDYSLSTSCYSHGLSQGAMCERTVCMWNKLN